MAHVIAAVSASSGSPQALTAAAAEARARSADLIALQAWRPPRRAPLGAPDRVGGSRPAGAGRSAHTGEHEVAGARASVDLCRIVPHPDHAAGGPVGGRMTED
ncbi:universal stress protein [Microbacterium kribbense]|uniref:universal stress protein n=1 Tax=Microbacterium kribbense TaxID=433645 RepID=UPI003CD095B7